MYWIRKGGRWFWVEREDGDGLICRAENTDLESPPWRFPKAWVEAIDHRQPQRAERSYWA